MLYPHWCEKVGGSANWIEFIKRHFQLFQRRFGCSHSIIIRLNVRFYHTRNTSDRQHPCQCLITTPRQDCQIAQDHTWDRRLPAARTATTVQSRRTIISGDTVRRRPHAAGLYARCHVGPILTDRNRNKQLWSLETATLARCTLVRWDSFSFEEFFLGQRCHLICLP